MFAAQVPSSWHAGNARSAKCFLHFQFIFVLSVPLLEFPWATLPTKNLTSLECLFDFSQVNQNGKEKKTKARVRLNPSLQQVSVRLLISETCLSFPCCSVSMGDCPTGCVHAVRSRSTMEQLVPPCTLAIFFPWIFPSVLPGLIYDCNCLQFPEWP